MKFWDSSALLPLIVEETNSSQMTEIALKDQDLWVWWGTIIECRSAVARRFREGKLTTKARQQILTNLEELSLNWYEIQPSSMLRDIASRLVAVHSLRAADSLQLAAAITARGSAIRGEVFLTFDSRLAVAATLEGFEVPFGELE